MHRTILVATVLTVFGISHVHAQCQGDINGDGQVTVSELVTAVNAALNGCGAFLPAGDAVGQLTYALGSWFFDIPYVFPVHRYYVIDQLVHADGKVAAVGREVDDGYYPDATGVTVGRDDSTVLLELAYDDPQYTFRLTDRDQWSDYCEVYLLNQVAPDRLEGILRNHQIVRVGEEYLCSASASPGTPSNVVGLRKFPVLRADQVGN